MEFKDFLIVAATLALILSVMLLAAPKALIKTSEVLNRDINSTEFFSKNRVPIGCLLVGLGVLMLYLVY